MREVCKDCGEEMKLIDVPQEVFSIPFTKGRFSIWDWNKKQLFCTSCAQEKQRNNERDMYDSIADKVGKRAYYEGYRDGRMNIY